MKKLAIIVYWVAVLALIAILLQADPGLRVQTHYDILRVLFPIVALGILFGFERLLRLHLRSITKAIIQRCLAAPFLVLGLNWLCIFTLTDYRAHRRFQVLPLAVAFLVLGFGLAHLWLYELYEKTRKADN